MPYKVVINRCVDSNRAALVADEIAKWSGIAKEKVFKVIVTKNICIRMETDKEEAFELKEKFEAVGAVVRMVEYGSISTTVTGDILKNKTENEDRKITSRRESFNLLRKIKTDIIIFGKKAKRNRETSERKVSTELLRKPKTDMIIFGKEDKGNRETPDKKESVKKTERNANQPNKEKKQQKKSKTAKIKSQDLGDKLITSKYRDEYIKELFRSLRTKVLMGLHDLKDKSIVITSLDAGTGKSTMASNIAISVAQQSKKTILIDGDLKRGVLHEFFTKEQSPGLSDFLLSEDEITEHSVTALMKPTHVPNLSLITSGRNVTNSSELLTSDRFIHLKKELSENFEIIILDTPPLGAVTDAVVVNEIFSKYLIVVRAGVTNVVDMNRKVREYPALKQKVLGLVLNCAAVDKMLSYYKRSKYYTEKAS